jgi:hypothetical protein
MTPRSVRFSVVSHRISDQKFTISSSSMFRKARQAVGTGCQSLPTNLLWARVMGYARSVYM